MYDEDKQRNVYKTKQSSSLRGFPVVMSAAAITTTAECKIIFNKQLLKLNHVLFY